jgi:hypothetical protein
MDMSLWSSMRATAFAVLLTTLLVHPVVHSFAGTITFFDLTDTVTATLSSDIIARGSTISCAGEVCAVTLFPPKTPSGSTSFANTTILELGSQAISDIISVVPTFTPDGTFNVQSFAVTFTSDSEGGPSLSDLGNHMFEDGSLQQADSSTISWFPTGGRVDDTIFFQSDAVEIVPEPGSLAVFGIATGGFALLRRGKRKSA